MLFLVLFLLGSLHTVTGWQCPNGKLVPGIYTNSGQPAIIGFQTTIQTFDGLVQYIVAAFNNSYLYSATFYKNHLLNENSYLESKFIGNANTGNFTVKTNGVHTQDGGVYKLQYKKGGADWYTEMCSVLFVLGKPQKAAISHDNNNVQGRNSTLSCNSLSTTYPKNHTLSFTYNWKVNGITNPSSNRYKYGTSNKTLTIMSVTKDDANKIFKCSATESGYGVSGLTSNHSDELFFTVIYGPDKNTTKLTPPDTEYISNEGIILSKITCIGDCWPKCNFKWTKLGTNGALTVSNDAVLSLGTLSRTEAASYTCEVTNTNATVRTERKQVVVHVNYGPDASTTNLTPSLAAYTRNEGDSLHDINCSGKCYPSCNYTWSKSGSNAAVNGATLSLGLLVRTEAGNYTCTVSNPKTGKKQTKTVSLFLRYGPDTDTTTLAPANTTYTLFENTRLDDIICAADCFPECQYKWTKQDNTVVSNNGVLSLGALKRNKATTYTCTVTNSQTAVSVTKQVSVIVIYGPDAGSVKLSPVKRTYTENEGTRLNDITCSAECYPTCSYEWTKSGTSTVVSNTGVLTLGTLNREKAAAYTCTATNPRKSGSAATDVIVHVRYPPDVNVSLSTENITQGNTLNVSCVANGVPSDYSYSGLSQTWNGTPVPNTHREVSGTPRHSSLHIPSLQLQDSGTYTCYVNNEVKTADTVSSVTVKVKVFPKILTDLLKFAGKTDGIIEVSVPFYSYPDIEEVSFKRQNGQKITNDTAKKYIVSYYRTAVHDNFYGKDISLNGMQANLMIKNLKRQDFGNYTLILKNELGKIIAPFIIVAESPPSGAFDIKVDNIQQNTARVSWIPGFHGGFAQTFLILLSTDQKHWKNEETIFGGTDASEEPMYEALSNLQGSTTYYVRMYALNRIGTSPFSEVHNFTTLPITEVQDNSAAITAGAIGGAMSGFVVIAVIVVVVVLVRKEIITKDSIRTRIQIAIRKKQKDQAEVETDGQDNSIRMYEHLNHTANSQSATVYDALKVDLKATGNSKNQYENLSKAVSTSPTYVNISAGKWNKNANQTYENLKLHSENE